MSETLPPEIKAVIWLGYDNQYPIDPADVPKVTVKSRTERRTCRHQHTAKVNGPTPGGWPGICLTCGARWR